MSLSVTDVLRARPDHKQEGPNHTFFLSLGVYVSRVGGVWACVNGTSVTPGGGGVFLIPEDSFFIFFECTGVCGVGG